MSEIFNQYEVDYVELTAQLATKVAAVGALSGELRSSKLSEVEQDAAELEALLRRMELEARSLGAGLKAPLLAKVGLSHGRGLGLCGAAASSSCDPPTPAEDRRL